MSSNRVQRDKPFEEFPECIEGVSSRDKSDHVVRLMCSTVDAVRSNSPVYYRYKDKSPQGYVNFADYQLRHAEWLPCKPSLFHADQRVAPCEAFSGENFSRSGLGALFPEVDKGNIGEEEWWSHIVPSLRVLGVREKLPEEPQEWHHWMCELPKMATKVGEDEQEARARTEKGGLVWTAADALYRRYLQLNVENEEAPEGIEVPCVAWASGCETLTFDPPNKVYYVDEPHFEEVRREILRKGFKLFIVSLKAGGKAPKRLGVRRLSEHLRATPRSGAAVQEETEKLVARYKERRAALTLSAGLSKSLPEDLAINVVRELRLQLSAKRGEVADVEVLSRRTEDGSAAHQSRQGFVESPGKWLSHTNRPCGKPRTPV